MILTRVLTGGKFERAEIYHAHEGFINWCKGKAPELLDCKGISQIKSDFDSCENNLKPEVMQFDQAIRVATTMRCLFSTKEGRIGLGLLVVLEGDRMFILDGGKASFILRRFGKKLINHSIEGFEFTSLPDVLPITSCLHNPLLSFDDERLVRRRVSKVFAGPA